MTITNSAMERRFMYRSKSEVRKRSTFNTSNDGEQVENEDKTNEQPSPTNIEPCGPTPITSFLHSSGKFLKKTFSFYQDQKENTIVEVDSESNEQEKVRNVEESFHSAIRWILKIAQLFGILPVQGVLERDPNKLNFHILSFRVAYTIMLVVCFFVLEIMAIWYLVGRVHKDGTKILIEVKEVIGASMFYGNASIATILFMKLASRWKTIIINWKEMENKVQGIKLSKLSRHFAIMTAMIMVPALIEHILSWSVDYQKAKNLSTKADPFEKFMNQSFSFIYHNPYKKHSPALGVKYSTVLAAFLCVSCTIATFIWNFTDLFIILISMALRQHFIHFNKCVNQAREVACENEWKKLREHYHSLSSLVKDIDNEISSIVLLSFVNNLGFVGLQLVNIFVKCNPLQRTYFFVSFLFLMMRTLFVTRNASKINEESRACLHDIYSCPSENYCTELRRLQIQVTTDEIALTGMRIFTVTRNLMLVVTGSIFTYAVILLQFYVALTPLNQSQEEPKMDHFS